MEKDKTRAEAIWESAEEYNHHRQEASIPHEESSVALAVHRNGPLKEPSSLLTPDHCLASNHERQF